MESFMEAAKAKNWAVEPQGKKKEYGLEHLDLSQGLMSLAPMREVGQRGPQTTMKLELTYRIFR
jgi:hypothetical protein